MVMSHLQSSYAYDCHESLLNVSSLQKAIYVPLKISVILRKKVLLQMKVTVIGYEGYTDHHDAELLAARKLVTV